MNLRGIELHSKPLNFRYKILIPRLNKIIFSSNLLIIPLVSLIIYTHHFIVICNILWIKFARGIKIIIHVTGCISRYIYIRITNEIRKIYTMRCTKLLEISRGSSLLLDP